LKLAIWHLKWMVLIADWSNYRVVLIAKLYCGTIYQ